MSKFNKRDWLNSQIENTKIIIKLCDSHPLMSISYKEKLDSLIHQLKEYDNNDVCDTWKKKIGLRGV